MVWFTKLRLIVFLVGISIVGSIFGWPLLFPNAPQKIQTPPIAQADTQGDILGESDIPTIGERPTAIPTPTTFFARNTRFQPNIAVIFTTTPTPVQSETTSDTTPTPTPVPKTNTNTGSTPTPSVEPKVEQPPTQTILEFLVGSDVTVTVPGESAKKGVNGQKVVLGSTISTGSSTQAQLVYPTGGVTRLDSGTRVVFTEEPTPTSGGNISIQVGRTWQRVMKVLGVDSFETDTATALASVRGTSYGHSLETDGAGNPVDRVITLEGKVGVKCKKRSEAEVLVKPNEDLKVSCKSPSYNPRLAEIPAMSDSEIKWVLSNLIRDEQLKNRFKGINFGDPENPEVIYSDNLPPVVDAGPDQTITVGAVLKLKGSVTDDHLPFKAKPVTLWASMDSGAAVQASDQKNLNATALYSKPGVYRFRLVASDLAVQASDEVTVAVLPQNKPPVVNIGNSLTIDPLTQIQIVPTVTDDGLPSNTLTYEWEVNQNQTTPPKVVISNITAQLPTFTFYRSGEYRVGLKVSDGALSSTKAFITITVRNLPTVTISSVNPLPCSTNSSCSGTTVVEVNGTNFNEYTRVKLLKNSVDVLGAYSGGNQASQILTDFVNLEVCGNYRAVVYFEGLDVRTATSKPFTFNPAGNCKKPKNP